MTIRGSLLKVVRSIFDMVGPDASESLGDDTPEERVERVFGLMARVSHNQGSLNHDRRCKVSNFYFKNEKGHISREDFIEGAKRDECIVQAITLYDDLV